MNKKLNIVISGCFTESALGHYGRDDARRAIEQMGCNVRSDINKSTNCLVVGSAVVPGRGVGPSKLKQAKDMGIPVVTLEELKRKVA